MEKLDLLCLALFDSARNLNTFKNLENAMKEVKSVQDETTRLKNASDKLQNEIIALDAQRATTSKMIDAAYPPEAKKAAQEQFELRFKKYFSDIQEKINQHVIDTRELQLRTATKIAQAQEIELQALQSLKK